MTEEIIIDGVDVAGCCLFTEGNCMQRIVDKHIIDNDVTCNGICDYGALYRKEYIIKPLERELNELKAFDSARQEVLKEYKDALKDIKEIVSEPCIDSENCTTCNSNCMNKDILNRINEVLNEGK